MNRLRNAGCKKEKEGIKLRGNVKKKKGAARIEEKKKGKGRKKRLLVEKWMKISKAAEEETEKKQ